MAKHSKGKHASPAASIPPVQPVQPAPSPVAQEFSMDEGSKVRKRRGLKIFGITMGAIAGVLVLAYLAGVLVFTGRFFPNTFIADIDVSLKTPEEVHQVMDEAVDDYQFRVVGQGLDLTLTSHDVDMVLDTDVISQSVMADVNAWAWPLEVFSTHDETDSLAQAYSSSALADVLGAAVAELNATAQPPVDATVAYDEASRSFGVVAESYGTMLDADAVVRVVAEGTMSFQPKITLTPEVLAKPAVMRDDPRLAAAAAEANEMIKADLQLMMDGNLVAEVTPTLVASWVVISEDVTVAFDDAAFSTWVDEAVAGCNTVGTTRSYTRADGKAITVSGGSYGWKVDGDALRALITDGVKSGTVGAVDVPTTQTGNGFTQLGSRDWGARYCDIDLSEQHARFYDESGALVWESDIVSGAPGSRATPEGVYYVTSGKASPTKLIGQKDPETGEPEYISEVTYWMPFVRNMIGLHDANWQSAFGGTRYKQGYGSHGCVNLPVSKAAELYNIIKVGDVVVVHS